MKTTELTGNLLDYWVGKAEGIEMEIDQLCIAMHSNGEGLVTPTFYSPSTDWADGGPIIDQERIMFDDLSDAEGVGNIRATISRPSALHLADGPTHLIAAMRCYVASKYGAEVPDTV